MSLSVYFSVCDSIVFAVFFDDRLSISIIPISLLLCDVFLHWSVWLGVFTMCYFLFIFSFPAILFSSSVCFAHCSLSVSQLSLLSYLKISSLTDCFIFLLFLLACAPPAFEGVFFLGLNAATFSFHKLPACVPARVHLTTRFCGGLCLWSVI